MKISEDFDREEPAKKTGKGFYIALAICLIAVCGIAVTTFVGTMAVDDPSPDTVTTTTTATTTTTEVQQVVIPATDIPDERTTTTQTTTTTTAATTAKPLFVFPVSNRVLCGYSELHRYSETLGEWITHNGTDFAAKTGDTVKSIADGTVVSIRKDALWGDVIECQYDGNVTARYYGVTARNIKEGQEVKMGQEIGVVSDIPAEIVDDAHMHLELCVNGAYIDPLTLIQGETVTVTKATVTTTTATGTTA